MMRDLFFAATVSASVLLMGCASSVEMASKEESTKAKEFKAPAPGNSGLYIYRSSLAGQALKKNLWIDGTCIGESANRVFFYAQVPGDKTYQIDTGSAFSPQTLEKTLAAGRNYFFRHFIRTGLFQGAAGVEEVLEEQGKLEVSQLEMARSGHCSSER